MTACDQSAHPDRKEDAAVPADVKAAIGELAWYFHRGETDCISADPTQSPTSLTSTARHRRIRQTLGRIADEHSRILACAFEPRAYRYVHHLLGVVDEVELTSVATHTKAFRDAFAKASRQSRGRSDENYEGRAGVRDQWIEWLRVNKNGDLLPDDDIDFAVVESAMVDKADQVDRYGAFVVARSVQIDGHQAFMLKPENAATVVAAKDAAESAFVEAIGAFAMEWKAER